MALPPAQIDQQYTALHIRIFCVFVLLDESLGPLILQLRRAQKIESGRQHRRIGARAEAP